MTKPLLAGLVGAQAAFGRAYDGIDQDFYRACDRARLLTQHGDGLPPGRRR